MTSQTNESAAKPAHEGNKECVLADDESCCCMKPEEHKRCTSVFTPCDFCGTKIDICSACKYDGKMKIECTKCLYSNKSELARRIGNIEICGVVISIITLLAIVLSCSALFAAFDCRYKILALPDHIAELERTYLLFTREHYDATLQINGMAATIKQLTADVAALRAALSELEKRHAPAPDPDAARRLQKRDTLYIKFEDGDEYEMLMPKQLLGPRK